MTIFLRTKEIIHHVTRGSPVEIKNVISHSVSIVPDV